MKKIALVVLGLLLSGCQSSIQQGPEFASAFPAKEWSKSGGGLDVKYVCKVESCGGANTEVNFTTISNFGRAPELGLDGSKKLEVEFRNNASLRTTLVSMLRQALRSDDPNGSINMNYFNKDSYVGYRVSGYSAKTGTHILGEVRIDDNAIILIGVESEKMARLRPLFAKLSSNLVIKEQS
jgi:hypothetical protein